MTYPPSSGSPYSTDPSRSAGADAAPQSGGYSPGAPAGADPGGTGPGGYGSYTGPGSTGPGSTGPGTGPGGAGPGGYGPGFQAGAPGPFPGPQPREAKSRRAPAILLGSGLVLGLVALVIVIVSAGRFATIDSSLSPIDATGATTRTLSAGSAYGLYSSSYSARCTVTGPDGRDVPVTRPSSNITINNEHEFGIFTATASGSYTISCTSSDTYIGDDAEAGSFVGAILGFIAGIFGLIAGVLLFIIGLVWFLSRGPRGKVALRKRVVVEYSGGGQP